MTAPVKDLEKLHTRQIESIKRQHDRTIKRMEDGHTTHKAEVKKAHEAEIVDIQNNNNIQVMNEAEKKEKVLIDLQSRLDNTKRLTDKELEQLKRKFGYYDDQSPPESSGSDYDEAEMLKQFKKDILIQALNN